MSDRPNLAENVLVPVAAVGVAMLIGMLLIAVTGNNPLQAYGALIQGAVGSATNLTATIMKATPLILAGLSVAAAFRAGLFNIGGTGQLIVGMLAAGAVAIHMPGPWFLVHGTALVLAGLAGAAWGCVAGYLKATRGAHEVITTIMLNYIAIRLGEYLLSPGAPLQQAGSDSPQSDAFSPESGFLILFEPSPATYVHTGVLLALVAAFGLWFLLERMTHGFRIRAVGFNPDAAEYGGIRVAATIILAMSIAGALAGLAGAVLTMGESPFRLSKSDFPVIQVGFTGIAVALLGRSSPLGVVLAALLFGALDAGATEVQFSGGLPPGQATKLIEVIMGLVVFFVGMDALFRDRVRRWLRPRITPDGSGL